MKFKWANILGDDLDMSDGFSAYCEFLIRSHGSEKKAFNESS